MSFFEKVMKKNKVLTTVLLLSPLVFSFAFAMDIYIPAVPAMKELLHTSQDNIQLTLSVFMFVTGLGQLLIGPISDRYGRKLTVLWSIVFFIVGSSLCASANNISVLIIARAIQSFGGCGMLVTAFAIVRDQYTGNDAAKVYSFLNCGVGMSPLFAPIIGSYLLQWFNWRAGFIFLSVMSVIIFIVAICKIQETLPIEKRVKLDSSIFLRYWNILKNFNFLSYSLCSTAGLLMFFVFFSSSPYIIIKLLHVPVKDFGYYFFTIGATFFLGSLICGKISGRIGVLKTVLFGNAILFSAGILMFIWFYFNGVTAAQFLLPCMMAGVGGSFMMGAGLAGAMEQFGEIAGSAAAMAGCLQFFFAAWLGGYIMHWPVNSTLPLSITMIILGAITLIVMLFYKFQTARCEHKRSTQ